MSFFFLFPAATWVLSLLLTMVLYVIGLGLGDEKDITVRGLEAVRGSAKVVLEHYTSILGVDKAKLVSARNNGAWPQDECWWLARGRPRRASLHTLVLVVVVRGEAASALHLSMKCLRVLRGSGCVSTACVPCCC